MKIISFAFLFVIIAITSFTTFGQIQTVRSSDNSATTDIAARFQNLEGMIDITKGESPTAVLKSTEARYEKRGDPAPGEEAVFLLRANHSFIRRGETLEVELIPMITSSRTLYAGGQVLRPGNDGEYDGTQPLFYIGADNGSYGQIDGMRVLKPIKFLSRMFTQEDNLGRYSYNIVITDSSGRLVQQIIVEFYLVNAGHWGRFIGYVNSARELESSIRLTGKFPRATPIFFMVGSPDAGAAISGPNPRYAARSNDGTHLVLGTSSIYSRTTAEDIMLWSPVDRYAIIAPRALIVDVPPAN